MEKMDEETVLMMVSDHGMKKVGGHGGTSMLEMTTPLFAYSKKKFNKKNMFNVFDPNL